MAPGKFSGGHGEGDVGRGRIVRHDLDDHVDIDVGFGQRHEDRGRDPGLSATSRKVICASSREKAMPVTTSCSMISPSSSQMSVAKLRMHRIVERRAHVEPDLVHHGHFYRAHLHAPWLRATTISQHFLERHFVEAERAFGTTRGSAV